MAVSGIDLETSDISVFCERRKIRRLSLFGSILRDDLRPDSDIDFLADFCESAE